jgi:general secretion pathway protein D
VIGGLMQQKDHTNITSVPVLGDIPLLGHLFQYTTKQKVKTNLLVMLTPFIIKDQLDLEQIRERRQREADEFMNSQRALDGMTLDRSVNYARKRGVVEEINLAVESVEEEAALRGQAVHPPAIPTGAVTPSRD